MGTFSQFSATGYDAYNNLVTGISFSWSTNVGLVNSTGYFTSLTSPAVGWVRATSGAVSGNSVVTIVVGQMHHIVVAPNPVNIVTGASLQFTATAYDIYNNVLTGSSFTWSTDVGTVDGTGMFTSQVNTGTACLL